MKIGDALLALSVRIQTKVDDAKEWSQSKLRDEVGATAVEYALVTAVVTVGVVGAASWMYEPLQEFFKNIVGKLVTLADTKLFKSS